MKILIAYSSKTGTAKKCAELLSTELKNHNVSVVDLSNNAPDPSDFDISVIGGSIRMGKLDKRTKAYISENKEKLMQETAFYFICNGFHDETETYFKKNFSREILSAAQFYDSFGGEMRIADQKGLDKLILKMVISANEEEDDFVFPTILTEAIGRFAQKIKEITK